MKQNGSAIIIENDRLRLTLREDAIAESLILKSTGEELLVTDALLPFCALSEPRPFNNEIKLAYPNKQMTFSANRVRMENGRLYVGFELVLFEAILEICERPDYITFRLVDFHVPESAFNGLAMDTPPVDAFRILQLPIRRRARFGEWLNAVSDDAVAIGVLATSPYEDVDSLRTRDTVVLFANALDCVKLRDTAAALIVSEEASFLDCIASMEQELGLPLGVKSRRSDKINRSALWSSNLNPTNVDAYIELAKRAGLTHMLLYYTCLFKHHGGYETCGDYEECDLRETYVNGFASVREMLTKLHDAGITVGIHFLHTHIGLTSRYVTPVADHRLRLKKRLTLSRPLGKEDTEIFVEESLHNAPMHPNCRVLRFGGELITYESVSKEAPYKFTGCVRGAYKTNITDHERGQIGGVMDISEFGATSFYLDQETSLQDEIAEALAKVYDLGFSFIYFDGSEGTSAPFNVNVSLAQHRVIQKLATPPIYCEGAAKTHFGWHWMSGGNAFDIFPAPIFKEKIVEHPFEEAFRMAQDYTRLNFGWWNYSNAMLPDMYEYGNALAFSHDCPVTIMMNDPATVTAHPRAKDILEVFRRWEDARAKGFLTEEQKLSLRNTAQEHTLLINEEGEYELVPCTRVSVAQGSQELTAYVTERRGRSYAILFHNTGSSTLTLSLPADEILYEAELGGERLPFTTDGTAESFVVSDRRYLSTPLPLRDLVAALEQATLSND